jgi:hypothetical protein
VRPLGLDNRALDNYVVYFCVIASALSLHVKIGIRAPGDCKDHAMSCESFVLLLGFLDIWRRWRSWVGFSFDLGVGVVLHWVGDMQNYWRICYLWSWRRVSYLSS